MTAPGGTDSLLSSPSHLSGLSDQRFYRKKACDLCAKKKIKCDMLLPVCSNCVLYDADCRAPPDNARAVSRVKKPRVAKTSKGRLENDYGRLEHRLGRMEQQLEKIVSIVGKDSYGTKLRGLIHDPLVLPAFEHLQPGIEQYFRNFNKALPLFQREAVEHLLLRWYSQPATHDKTTWAVILAISAVGLRMVVLRDEDEATLDLAKIAMADSYARNALSVASDIANDSRHCGFWGVQALVALAIFFNCIDDIEKASSMVALAVSLSHRLQLHSKTPARLSHADNTQQRSAVFWIMFNLEKALSARGQYPSILSRSDVDISLPRFDTTDGGGTMISRDGTSCFRYFETHLDLMTINDELRSASQAGMGSSAMVTVRHDLAKWYASVPLAFHVENARTQVEDCYRMQLTKMYHSYFLLLLSAHGAFTPKSSCMQNLSQTARIAVQEYSEEGLGGSKSACLAGNEQPPADSGDVLMTFSLGYINLMGESPLRASTWYCMTTYSLALILLVANSRGSSSEIASKSMTQSKTLKLAKDLMDSHGCSPELRTVLLELGADNWLSNFRGNTTATSDLPLNLDIQNDSALDGSLDNCMVTTDNDLWETSWEGVLNMESEILGFL